MKNKRGWFRNSKEHKKAGSKGGKSTFLRYGSAFFKKIGKKGGSNKRGLSNSQWGEEG